MMKKHICITLLLFLQIQLFCDIMTIRSFENNIFELSIDKNLYFNASQKIIPCSYKIINYDSITSLQIIQYKYHSNNLLDTALLLNSKSLIRNFNNSYSVIRYVNSITFTKISNQTAESLAIANTNKTIPWQNEKELAKPKKINGKLYFSDLLTNYPNINPNQIDSALIFLKIEQKDSNQFILKSVDTTLFSKFPQNKTKRSSVKIQTYLIKYWYFLSLLGLTGIALVLYFRNSKKNKES